MIDVYSELSQYAGNNWSIFLKKVGVEDIFADLMELSRTTYQEMAYETVGGGVKYILWTYSVRSDRLDLGMEWERIKQNNFSQSGLPATKWADFGLLKSEAVVKTVYRWLDFQDEPVMKQLVCLKDLRLEMQLSAVSPIMRGQTDIDYDQKFKNAKYAIELEKMIAECNAQLVKNNPRLSFANKEMDRSKRPQTLGPESYAK